MKYYVNTANEAHELARTIDQRKYSVLIAKNEYPSDNKYNDICIYYKEA